MRTVSSYGVEIRKQNIPVRQTMEIYRQAVGYLTEIYAQVWEELRKIPETKKRFNTAEHMVHMTKKNTARFDFDLRFPKMPSYLRRSAIQHALGSVSSYETRLGQWKETGVLSGRPKLTCRNHAMPVFYRDVMYREGAEGKDEAYLKLYDGHDWKWFRVYLKRTDMEYLRRNWKGKKASAPALEKRHSAVRDANSRNLEEIITDIPEISRQISDYLNSNSPEEKEKLRFYDDKLLPLYKLYRLETVLEEIQHEKVWLNSGGFLVIQQTEAFVSIDVNSGKFTGKKKMQETYRKINLEAAKEIARQLRLRNLSGIILIDFINMENQDHQDELFHVLQKYLRKDPVKAKAVDVTPLHILELTRKKVRKPVIEEIREL